MKFNIGDKIYTKIVELDVIYKFRVDKALIWKCLVSNICFKSQTLKLKIENFQILDVGIVYNKVEVLSMIAEFVVNKFMIWSYLES